MKRFEKINPSEMFGGNPTGIDLEVGFGQSSFVVEHAQRNPTRLVIGVEVRKQAVAHVQTIADASGAKNVLLVYGNGTLCLEDMFHDEVLDTIFIFHPDPWVKRRHHKRRLINPAFITLCKTKLKVGGKIHISTDVQELWQEIIQTFNDFGNAFSSVNDDPFWITDYTTKWDAFSKSQQRKTFCATFCKR